MIIINQFKYERLTYFTHNLQIKIEVLYTIAITLHIEEINYTIYILLFAEVICILFFIALKPPTDVLES